MPFSRFHKCNNNLKNNLPNVMNVKFQYFYIILLDEPPQKEISVICYYIIFVTGVEDAAIKDGWRPHISLLLLLLIQGGKLLVH